MFAAGYLLSAMILSATPVEAILPNSTTTVSFQAHRGGMDEAPENTLPALKHAWGLPGAVPEIDLRTTKDGVIVCIHDETPARTTDAPEPLKSMNIRDISLETLRALDAGRGFDAAYAGTRIPTLHEVFGLMQEHPDRRIYLDLKEVDPDQLHAMISEYVAEERIIFVHGDPAVCLQLSERYPRARTMTWLSGTPQEIRRRYETMRMVQFQGIDQLQFHLHVQPGIPPLRYVLEDDFLQQATAALKSAGSTLQLRPFAYDPDSLATLIHMGVSWYVTDAPQAFHAAVMEALALLRTKQERPPE